MRVQVGKEEGQKRRRSLPAGEKKTMNLPAGERKTMKSIKKPASGVRISAYGCTDVGVVRTNNEDNFLLAVFFGQTVRHESCKQESHQTNSGNAHNSFHNLLLSKHSS